MQRAVEKADPFGKSQCVAEPSWWQGAKELFLFFLSAQRDKVIGEKEREKRYSDTRPWVSVPRKQLKHAYTHTHMNHSINTMTITLFSQHFHFYTLRIFWGGQACTTALIVQNKNASKTTIFLSFQIGIASLMTYYLPYPFEGWKRQIKLCVLHR